MKELLLFFSIFTSICFMNQALAHNCEEMYAMLKRANISIEEILATKAYTRKESNNAIISLYQKEIKKTSMSNEQNEALVKFHKLIPGNEIKTSNALSSKEDLKAAGFTENEIEKIIQAKNGIEKLHGMRLEKFVNWLENGGGRKLSIYDKIKLRRWLKDLKPEEQFNSDQLISDFEELNSSNSLAFSIKDEMKFNEDKTSDEILNFYSIEAKNGPSAQKFKKFDQWVKSDSHALFLYDHLSKNLSLMGQEKNGDLLRYLISYNKYFKNVQAIKVPPYSLISYSFEKESAKKEISLWFKKAGMSDEDWIALPEETRINLLKEATYVNKVRINENIIASTSLKPSYVGNYSQELSSTFEDKNYAWEIANKKYEISLNRALNQIHEVSNSFKETHSFHTHIVFDIPENYSDFDKFQIWSKHINDYLYFKGMEEGLHGNYLTGVAHFPEDAPPITNITDNQLPSHLAEVNDWKFKFFSMGIRREIYGKSPLKGYVKLGLELRDPIRNLNELDNAVKTISSSVQDYRWEKLDKNINRKNLSFIRPNTELFDKELKGLISEKLLTMLKKGDVNTSIPLQKFEEGSQFNFQVGKEFRPTKEQKERILRARAYFISEIKKIDLSLAKMDLNGKGYDDSDVEYAIKATMSEWAKKARISELFKYY